MDQPNGFTRRDIVKSAAAAVAVAAAAQLPSLSHGQTTGTAMTPATSPSQSQDEIRWLDGQPPAMGSGVTWGVPWPRGACPKSQTFSVLTDKGGTPSQTWNLAYWPDGSVKWTAHAIGPEASASKTFRVVPGVDESTPPAKAVTVKESDDATEVSTGPVVYHIARSGTSFIRSIHRDGREVARDGQLVGLRQDQPDADAGAVQREPFTSDIEKVVVEQNGPVRVVIKIEGMHKAESGRAWLPFVLRLYFYAGAETLRVVHSFIFDGDEHKDFLCGLGVRFSVPMKDELYNRHVRFVGEGSGLWCEGLRTLTGLRRPSGRDASANQVAGKAVREDQIGPAVRDHLQYIPAWGDFTLSQLNADGFQIRKRTKAGCGWIDVDAGRRASGVGYIGRSSGGLAFGLRDFWQRHPTQLDIRSATADLAQVTLWLYSPEARPMDLRFYHDEMGMTSHPEELRGLDITYEDYEKGFGTPVGIARTSELFFWPTSATPSREELVNFASIVRTPPVLVCSPKRYLDAKVFAGLWSLPDRSTPAKALLEDHLDFLFDYYHKEVEQRHWYGFWNYGDVMHTYDPDRHVWRYDVGGFAWDNSELSPDLWLWYSFLRSGRADIFRFAEAMTRHTGEVDVYHLGPFKCLGTRHGVQHFGDSAKQLRISTAIYRRFYYYLTADERVGDLMREQIDADQTFAKLDPIRKIRKEPFTPQPHALGVGFGTDWSALASAWLTEWERTLDEKVKTKLLNSMKSIGSMPHGFYSAGATYDPDTGIFTAHGNEVGISHLSAVFGLVEVCAELLMLLDVPEFDKAWLDYCEFYNASSDEREKAIGVNFRTQPLTDAHSRLTAYAAFCKKDPKLAERAWKEFLARPNSYAMLKERMKTTRLQGPTVLNPVDEQPWISTNWTAQWGLAMMQNLALVGDAVPPL